MVVHPMFLLSFEYGGEDYREAKRNGQVAL
jgi:hypothetical protein